MLAENFIEVCVIWNTAVLFELGHVVDMLRLVIPRTDRRTRILHNREPRALRAQRKLRLGLTDLFNRNLLRFRRNIGFGVFLALALR